MTTELTLDVLKEAITGHAAAFRCVTDYQPAGGPGDKIFPPTYEGGKYAEEFRFLKGEKSEDDSAVRCVVLDSVQSQANRMELALLDAWEAEEISLPVIVVDFAPFNLPKPIRVTSLEAPHRIADAILRDSLYTEDDGKPVTFRRSSVGKVLDTADLRNATGIFQLCPTALLLGLWDSTGPRGGLGAKFQRAMVSEMVGWYAVSGSRSSSRIDPIEIVKGAGPVFRHKDQERQDGPKWTTDPQQALEGKDNKKVLYGLKKKEFVLWNGKNNEQEEGKPSKANHGNVTPSLINPETKKDLPGGFTVGYARQTTVISLPALRRLRFPLEGETRSKREVDQAAQCVLTALALYAATLTREQGADLRSRCQLHATTKVEWQLLDAPGEASKSFPVTSAQAKALLVQALGAVKNLGLAWRETTPDKPIPLTPSPDLVQLVRKSQEVQASEGAEAPEE